MAILNSSPCKNKLEEEKKEQLAKKENFLTICTKQEKF